MGERSLPKSEVTLVDPETVKKLRVPREGIWQRSELVKIASGSTPNHQGQFHGCGRYFIQQIKAEGHVGFEGSDFPYKLLHERRRPVTIEKRPSRMKPAND
jgi:hypothetical protein